MFDYAPSLDRIVGLISWIEKEVASVEKFVYGCKLRRIIFFRKSLELLYQTCDSERHQPPTPPRISGQEGYISTLKKKVIEKGFEVPPHHSLRFELYSAGRVSPTLSTMGTGKTEATRRVRQGKTGDGMANVRVKGENFYRYVFTWRMRSSVYYRLMGLAMLRESRP